MINNPRLLITVDHTAFDKTRSKCVDRIFQLRLKGFFLVVAHPCHIDSTNSDFQPDIPLDGVFHISNTEGYYVGFSSKIGYSDHLALMTSLSLVVGGLIRLVIGSQTSIHVLGLTLCTLFPLVPLSLKILVSLFLHLCYYILNSNGSFNASGHNSRQTSATFYG